jgi:acetyl-CoA C-acetyltransferase
MPVVAYSKKYGVTMEKMCEALDACSITLGRNAERNPKARYNRQLRVEAAEKGFNDVYEYLKSDEHNPYVSWPTRRKHWQGWADGASALIVCDASIAKKFHDTPIDVAGIGLSVGGGFNEDMSEWRVDKEGIDQAMKMAKIEGKDIDYLEEHDCCVINSIKISEMIGYIEKGEAWKAAIEGRLAFDGDKPINTDGGRPMLGHPYGATGGAMMAECIKQMRGEAEKRQITPEPETCLVHNYGSGLSVAVSILKRR